MQTLKRTIIFLTCFVVLLSSFCFGSLASEVYYDPYIDAGFEFDYDNGIYFDPYTGQEVFYDESEGSYYSLHEPLEYEPFEMFSLSSPNYPDFDVNKLPWLDMPSYIQDILYSEPIGLLNASEGEYTGEYKLPFVMVTVTDSYVAVYAGYNLCIGAYYSSSSASPNYALIAIKAHQKIYENSVCYKASYYRDYSLREPWTVYEPVAHGDNYVRYTYLSYSNASRDYYFYGSSGMYAGRTYQAMKINSTDTDSFPQYRYVNNPTSGFASGTIIYMPDNWGGYITSFAPPTADQIENSTNKGIWESIKELPQKIADSIKGFFTSLGDRIGDFFTSLKNYLLYFQETKPEHVNPFENILTDIQNFFDEQNENLREFKEEWLVSFNDETFLGGFFEPFISIFDIGDDLLYLRIVLVILLILFVIRKVIGR